MSLPPSNSELNNGDISWIIVSAGLVFLMCPGLAFFFSGLSRTKNALSLLYLSALAVAVVSFQWYLIGYSLTFSEKGSIFIGDFAYAALQNVYMSPYLGAPAIPASAFMVFQMMLSAFTPALAFGAAAERMSLGPVIIFLFVWSTLIYDFIAGWVWRPNGWLATLGVMDYAGGTAIHITSGAAAVAYSMVLGKRKDYGSNKHTPHNVSFVFLGLTLLWFGWFGLNGGSARAANARSVQALIGTHVSACIGGLTWIVIDYYRTRKWSIVGFCMGAVAGLVAITPGSGFVCSSSSLLFGLFGAIFCNIGVTYKRKYGFDDALNVFAVNYIGGVVGLLLTGIFSHQYIIGLSYNSGDIVPIGGWIDGHWIQVPIQLVAILSGSVWSFFGTYVILWVMNKIPGFQLRLKDDEEEIGTDLAQMGEYAYGFSLDSSSHESHETLAKTEAVMANSKDHILPDTKDPFSI